MPIIPHISPRADLPSFAESPSVLNPIYVVGIVVAVVTVLGISGWLGLRVYRKRAAAKRESKMGAAFLSVKGLVREDDPMNEKDDSLQRSTTQSKGFSRNMINSTIILPEKARIYEANTAQHPEPGDFPVPFAPKPFAFALGAASPRNSTLEPDRSSKSRNSFMSFTSSQNRFSVISGSSSLDPTRTSGTARKIRQIFDPVLPDELLTRLGEHLTVVQSFDDGWCVVGRENASLVHTAKSLFKSTPEPENSIELGVVPAWCFLKPVKGLRAERPMRVSSLGITVNLDASGSSRNELVSWSNF